MIDEYGRNIDYIRISVTDRCDLRCVYCMPEEGVIPTAHSEILTYDEIVRLAEILAGLGFKKIKLTGGEPMCRLGIEKLIASLKNVGGIKQVTITTNGVTLAKKYEALRESGVDGINISLDTTDRALYAKITRRDMLDNVLKGLEVALAGKDMIPLKINCVPMSREQKLTDVALLAKENDIAVRFIEMMPIGYGSSFDYISRSEVIAKMEEAFGVLTPYEGKALGNGPAEYFTAKGFKGKLGFISAVSHKFCGNCNRIRLTSAGYLKTCLQYETSCDLKSLLRGAGDDNAIADAIISAVGKKPAGHHFGEEAAGGDEKKTMSQIGG